MENQVEGFNRMLKDGTFEFPLMINDEISVLQELVVEIGCEIKTKWVDGRLHMVDHFDHQMVEAKIVTPLGDESSFLSVTFQEVQKNATINSPYFKSASPLGAGTGQYQIKIMVKSMCFGIATFGLNQFLFSVTPKIRFYVDDKRTPVVDMSYPQGCPTHYSGEGFQTILIESTNQWPISYKE